MQQDCRVCATNPPPAHATFPHHCRYRDPDANPPLFPLLRRCVLTPQVQLSASLQRCYASCSSALICSNVDVPASVAVSGQRVPVNTACTRLLDESVNFPESLGRSHAGPVAGFQLEQLSTFWQNIPLHVLTSITICTVQIGYPIRCSCGALACDHHHCTQAPIACRFSIDISKTYHTECAARWRHSVFDPQSLALAWHAAPCRS